jgi:hypothetical protein
MTRFKTFVSRKYISVLFTLFSILIINVKQLIVENFGWDNSFSVAAAKNVSDGHGYTLRMASANDLSKIVYEPLNQFPPGYSFLLVIVHAISFMDWVHSIYLLNAIALTVLVLLFRRTLYQLEFPTWIINISVLYFGFIDHPYYADHYTDLLGVVFFISGCICLIQIIKSGENLIPFTVMAALLFSFCACLRYLYVGIIFVPFFFFLYYSYVIKNKRQIISASVGILTVVFLIGALMLFQYLNSGTTLYINPLKTGFFPQQLLYLGHIFFASFISIEFIYQECSRFTSVPLSRLVSIGSIMNFSILIWIAYSAVKLLKQKKFIKNDARFFYAILSFLVGLSIFLLLAILTVVYNKDLGMMYWVYIQELRYYGPVYIMILQFSIFVILNPGRFLTVKMTRLFGIFIIMLALGQIWHSTHAIVKQVILSKNYGVRRHSEELDFHVLNLASHHILNKTKVVICSSRFEIPNMGSLSGSSSSFDISILNKPLLTSEPIMLITVLNGFENLKMGNELLKSGHHLELQSGGKFLYTKLIPKSIFVPGIRI